MRRNWSSREMLLCLAVYASLNESQRKSPPRTILRQLASLTGRTEGSISLRFQNFSSEDPDLTSAGRKGMTGGGSHVSETWYKFSRNDRTLDLSLLLREVAMNFYTLNTERQNESNG